MSLNSNVATIMKGKLPFDLSIQTHEVNMPEDIQEESPVTQKTPAVKKQQHEADMAAVDMHSTPLSNVAIPGTPPILPNIVQTKYVVRVRPIQVKESDVLNAQMFQERCRQICHS